MTIMPRCAALLVLGALAFAAPRALAQEPAALQKVTELNKRAVTAYENLEMEEAAKYLQEALAVCAAEGLNKHPLKARTHIHLGMVMVGGLRERDKGIQQFKRALEIDPTIQPTKSLLNPEIQAVFDDAVREMKGGPPTPPAPEVSAETAPPLAQPPTATNGPPADIKGILHQPVTESPPGATITVKAAVEPALGAEQVVLAYRAEGASDFLARDMEKDAEGWYVARIPEPATNGNVVSYYIEARDRAGQALAAEGSVAEPHVVSLTTTPTGAGEPPGISRTDEPGGPRQAARGARRYWLVLGIGSGAGWAKGPPELNPDDGMNEIPDFSGFAPAQLLHVSPEVGFFHSDRLILSIQARLQIVTGATEKLDMDCQSGVCSPAKGAIAVLGKATWLLGQPAKLRPFFSVAAGGGEIRHLISVDRLRDCGPGENLTCQDTVLGGRFLLGPAFGITYELPGSFSFLAGINALAGLPNTTLNFDFNIGLAAEM